MNKDYTLSNDEFLSLFRNSGSSFFGTSKVKVRSFGSRKSSDYYSRYGVDNDFDLIEAMYDKYHKSMNNAIRAPWFVEFRIQCAMNPEYTEKCLESRAFRDVKDAILRKLGDT